MNDGGIACVGAVLAGGRASRFDGRPKGLEVVGGRRILDRAAGAVRQVSDALVLCGSAPEIAGWLPGATVLPDAAEGAGPLAGLLSALRHADSAVLLVGWDMPFLSAALLGELRRDAERSGAPALAPESDADGRVEPLCAYYSAECAPVAAELLACGQRSMTGLLEVVGAVHLPLARVLDFGDPARIFFNVNTPADHEAAERWVLPSPAAR